MFEWLSRLFPHGARRQRVVVAIAYCAERQRYLVEFNPRWGGYSFPICRFRSAGNPDPLAERRNAVREARSAFRADLGPELGETTEGRWMDRIEVEGVSGRTGERTLYTYDIVAVTPAREIPEGPFGHRYGWLTEDEIRQSDPDEPGPLGRAVTWTTWQVLTRLLDNQRVAVAVIRHLVGSETRYLMTRNRYGDWFPPARRMDGERTPFAMLVNDFRDRPNYAGPVHPGAEAQVDLDQLTPHLGERSYLFHLVQMTFDGNEDRLAAALRGAGIDCDWRAIPLSGPLPPDLSPTLEGLRDAILALI